MTAYTARERVGLWVLAGAGLVLNGIFLVALVGDPGSMVLTMRNPATAPFVIEAMLLLATMSYMLHKWALSRIHWSWFIVLSLLGSIAFALPVSLLWARKSDGTP